MQSFDQYSCRNIGPLEIDRHIRRARTLRSEAFSNLLMSAFQSGSKMIQGFVLSNTRTKKV